MARRTKRLWTDEEKRTICFQTTVPGVSVAQVARRYAMNANMIFKWLRDPRYAPDPEAVEDLMADTSCFLPVEIVDRPRNDDTLSTIDPVPVQSGIEIDIAGGHRLRINGAYDPEALAELIRGLKVRKGIGMPSYREIQEETKARFGFTPKTCWIADIKAEHGLTRGPAPNRIDWGARKHPCPAHRRTELITIMAELGVLSTVL